MHDKHGTPIAVGDEVIVRYRIKATYPGAETCQITLETVERMTPTREHGDTVTLNGCQVEKV